VSLPEIERKKEKEKKFFSVASLYKKERKKIFRFDGFARFRTFSDFFRRSGHNRSLLSRPNSGTVQTAGPHRPKATRPSV
jgi:hypothetical protein